MVDKATSEYLIGADQGMNMTICDMINTQVRRAPCARARARICD